MYKRYVLESKKFPPPSGAYSRGIIEEFGDGLYIAHFAGLIGLNHESGELPKGIVNQTEKALDNLGMLLAEIGWGYTNLSELPATKVAGVLVFV